MTDRVKSLEAKVVALEDSVKLSMVKFRQALLLEMGNMFDRHMGEDRKGK